MKQYERKQLLEQVNREGATVGHTIPEQIDLDGGTFDLRAFVFEMQAIEGVGPEERERIDDVKRNLRRARRERVATLEDETEAVALTREEGERLVDEIVGIDRALNGLGSLEETDLEAEMQAADLADRKRWRNFLDRARGADDSRGGL